MKKPKQKNKQNFLKKFVSIIEVGGNILDNIVCKMIG